MSSVTPASGFPIRPNTTRESVGCGPFRRGRRDGGVIKQRSLGHRLVAPVGEQADDEAIEAEEEVVPKTIMTTPILPSAAEVELNGEDHIPYRPWCDECVEGQGRERGHSRAVKAEK